MWLLDVKTLELIEFVGDNIPVYAILSHAWDSEEVSFVEMKKPKHRENAKRKAGFHKIERCCAQAQRDAYAWIWVDSCCIDKRSSAELSEAINSMFQWYRLADRCYVYLSDTPSGSEAIPMLSKSRWFTRGWTLQELLAPYKIVFFAQDWVAIGYKANQRRHKIRPISSVRGAEVDDLLSCVNLVDELSTITNIPADFLVGKKSLGQACVAQRMFWASRRETTRAEDRAYSLMGLFDISMPVLYGEGLEQAFTRLQREIMRKTPDQSILLWYRADATSYRLLAESPDCFQNSGAVMQPGQRGSSSLEGATNWSSFSMTNLGLRITLVVRSMRGSGGNFDHGDSTEATLHCVINNENGIPRKISLNILFLNKDLEGCPIFMCYRPCKWTFSTGEGRPMRIFLCGNDYISALAKEKIVRPIIGIQEPKSVMSQVLDILANEAGVSHDELVDKMTFTAFGVDSLLWLSFRGRIREEVGLEIHSSAFIEYPTIGTFKGYLAQYETLNRKEILGSIAITSVEESEDGLG